MSYKLLAGFAAGVLLGVLFAPDKGSETRKKMSEKGADLKNKFNDFMDSLAGKVDEMVSEADDFATKAKSQFK